MIKTKYFTVPKGTKYLSEVPALWAKLPAKCILAKGKTGCGATTAVLKDETPTIVCEFTVEAVKSKAEALPNTLGVYEGVTPKQINDYIDMCENLGAPIKIITTIDSFPKVKNTIFHRYVMEQHKGGQYCKHLFYTRLVIDEYQRLLEWAGIKASTFYKSIEAMDGYYNIMCISATPPREDYLPDEFFKEMTPVELIWKDPDEYLVQRVKAPSPIKAARNLVRMYKNEEYPKIVKENGETIQSKELIIFCNSVSDILTIAASEELPAEECNFIIAKNKRNEKMLQSTGLGYTFGRVRQKNEESCKYTFCTNIGFDAIDIYSNNALSVAVSTPCEIKSLGIERDLRQIAGRQRNANNPFQKSIILIYNTGVDLNRILGIKEEIRDKFDSEKLYCDDLNNLRLTETKEWVNKQIKRYDWANYKDNFIRYDEEEHKFNINNLSFYGAILSLDTLADNYYSESRLERSLKLNGFTGEQHLIYLKLSTEALSRKIAPPSFAEGLKAYCDTRLAQRRLIYNETFTFFFIVELDSFNHLYEEIYNVLGPEICEQYNYKQKPLLSLLEEHRQLTLKGAIAKDSTIYEAVRQELLALPEAYCEQLKAACEEIFVRYGLNKSPKEIKRIAEMFKLNKVEKNVTIGGHHKRLYSFIE